MRAFISGCCAAVPPPTWDRLSRAFQAAAVAVRVAVKFQPGFSAVRFAAASAAET